MWPQRRLNSCSIGKYLTYVRNDHQYIDVSLIGILLPFRRFAVPQGPFLWHGHLRDQGFECLRLWHLHLHRHQQVRVCHLKLRAQVRLEAHRAEAQVHVLVGGNL